MSTASLVAQIASDFSGNDEGWTAPNTLTPVAYHGTGGNAGGYISAIAYNYNLGATTISVPLFFVAPGKFLGNRSSYQYGTLRFDLQQSSVAGNAFSQADAVISNGTVSLYYYPAVPFSPAIAPAWSSYSISLSAATGYWRTADANTGPAATDAEILAVLTNLTSLQIKGRSRTALTTGGLDNVTLTPPITINTQPSSTAACLGANASLTTAASGNTAITYQWQKQNSTLWNNVTNGGGYSGATTASLTVNTTGNVGAGVYRCQISGTNADDVYTSSATIVINALPSAPTTAGNASCSAAALTLTASGGAAGQYRWYTVASNGTALAGQTNATYTTPSLSATTTYYAAINNGTCESTRAAVTATIDTPPTAPTATGNASCSAAALTLTALGGTAGQYRWYTVATNGTAIAGQTNSTYTTPSLSATTTYYAAINNGTCESTRTAVTATINTPPAAPTTTGNASCSAAALTLNASGGTAGQYRWYTVATNGTAIPGQTNNTYTTPSLSTTTTYYAAINSGTCESTRTAVVATINTPPVAPTTTGNASCTVASLILNASGGANGQYRWYTVSTNGTAIPGQTNSTYTTPSLSVTATYYAAINNGTCESTRTAVTAAINTPPAAPGTTGNASCGPAALTLNATGAANGQYRWYTVATNGTAIVGQTNATYTTPSLSATTTYYAAINNGTCESARTAVVATINTPPAAPTTTGNASCTAASLTLNAAGGTNGQYRWYTVATNGTAIAGQTNNTYTTPTLSVTTTYYVAINNGTCQSTRTAVTATINTPPAAPTTTGSASCTPASLTLAASGGANGQYRWYTVASNGTPIAGQTNSTYTTATLSATTIYYVSINNGTCEGARTAVTAAINTIPNPPSVTDNSSCTPGSLTLTASGGTNGQYRWYTAAANGTAIAGQTNNTYITPALATTTTYYVAINNGACESVRVAITATIGGTLCTNNPPVIQPVPITAPVEGKVTLSLVALITDKDNNLDLSTLKVVVAPASGASATIDSKFNLVLDYEGISFSGTERLTLQVCDLAGACTQTELNVEVAGDVIVYNAVSPNNDGKNDFLFLQYIDVLQETKKNKVSIFGRWGDVVFEVSDYDNLTNSFKGLSNTGNELPSGTYFYKIEFSGNHKPLNGYLTLKR